LACALPALGALVLFIVHFSLPQTPVDEQRLAQAIAVSLDRELQAVESAARALAAAPGLKTGDYSGFHSQASALLRPDFPVQQVLLSDDSGQVLATTRDAMPRAANAARLQPVFAQARYALTRLTPDAPLALDVPLQREGMSPLAVTMLL
jgi:hypothetical protein